MSLRSSRFILVFTAIGMLGLSCKSDNKGSQPARETPVARPVGPSMPGESDKRPVIIVLGDSLTIGAGVEPEANFPSRLQRKLDEAGYRYRVVNAGISGETSAQGLNRLSAIVDQRPRVVIVALGSNDGLRGFPVESTRATLESILSRLKKEGIDVLLAGMRVPPNYGIAYTQEFREMFPALAKKHRIPLIPFLLEGVGGNRALNLDDGVHPNARGYEIVAENVWKVLRPMLK